MPSVAGPTVSVASTLQVGVGSSATAMATVIDTAQPVLPQLTASVVAGPAAAVSTGAAVKGAVSLYSGAPTTVPAPVPQYAADGLFTALGGGVEMAELAVLGNGAEQAGLQALTAETSAAGSAQAELDRLLWESEDSSWLDGEREWPQ
jgi:hypothetical protein